MTCAGSWMSCNRIRASWMTWGEPTEKIEAKETFHLLDAVRDVISYLHMDKPKGGFSGSPVARQGLQNL